jgi:hypothetical protein
MLSKLGQDKGALILCLLLDNVCVRNKTYKSEVLWIFSY